MREVVNQVSNIDGRRVDIERRQNDRIQLNESEHVAFTFRIVAPTKDGADDGYCEADIHSENLQILLKVINMPPHLSILIVY